MPKVPRRLPPDPQERLKILLAEEGSSVSGATRFQSSVTDRTPTSAYKETNKTFIQTVEPTEAEVGDFWIKE